MDAERAELPSELRWECLGCGRSCEEWSEVALDLAEAERLRRLPLFDPRLTAEPAGCLPWVDSPRDPGEPLLRMRETPEGARRCVLLDDDGRCAVHAAHGPEAKPGACRAFPFLLVSTPGGTRIAASFACTAIARSHGPEVARSGVALAPTFAAIRHRERRGFDLRLAPGTPLGWARYGELERLAGEELAGPGSPLAGLGRLVERVRRDAGLGPGDPRPAPGLRRFTLDWLAGLSGGPPRLRPPWGGLDPAGPSDLLARWLRHRLWRGDLLRGNEVLFALGLLVAETALALAWARNGAGGLIEAIAQVERGLALHSDLVERIERDPARRTRAGRLFGSPRYAASLLAPEG